MFDHKQPMVSMIRKNMKKNVCVYIYHESNCLSSIRETREASFQQPTEALREIALEEPTPTSELRHASSPNRTLAGDETSDKLIATLGQTKSWKHLAKSYLIPDPQK